MLLQPEISHTRGAGVKFNITPTNTMEVISENKLNSKANNTKYSKIKLPWFSHLNNTRPRNEMGLLYNAPEPTQAGT